MKLLLTSGGKYFVVTPHRFAGPVDLSKVFGLEESVTGHLCEYTWRLLRSIIKKSGFKLIKGQFPPWIWRKRLDDINRKLKRRHLNISSLNKLCGNIGLEKGEAIYSSYFIGFVAVIEFFISPFPQKIRRYIYTRIIGFDSSMYFIVE